MRLFLIRHGETDYNKRGIVQGGGIDSDLNDTGHRQARAFFETYRHLSFDAIYASDLKRTHQTLKPWIEELGYDLNVNPAIREFGWGELEGKQPTEEDRIAFRDLKFDWAQGRLDRGIPGGDTPLSCWQRAEPFLTQLRKRHMGEQILACSHGRTLRIVLSQLLGKGLQRMEEFVHTNTGVNVLQFDSSGAITVEMLNDTRHLDRSFQSV